MRSPSSRLSSLLVGVVACLAVNVANATAYYVVTPAYTGFANYTPPCDASTTCQDYAAGSHFVGTFSTAAPIPASFSGSIIGSLTSFQFADGVQTYADTDAATRVVWFDVTTDATGAITSQSITLQRWRDGAAGPHAVNDWYAEASFTNAGTLMRTNLRCATMSAGPDACLSAVAGTTSTSAASGPVGAWSQLPTISINDVSAVEGNSGATAFTFSVTLSSAPSAMPVTVDWSTAGVTALADADFLSGSGTLTWALGDGAPKTMTVQVLGDTLYEPAETFNVVLTVTSGASIDDPVGVGTILNDDAVPPDLSLTVDDGGLSVAPGGVIAYNLTARNLGGPTAQGVTFVATVPAHATFDAGLSTPGWACVPGIGAGAQCTLNIGPLVAGASQLALFTVDVDAVITPAATSLSFNASVVDDGSLGIDPLIANNAAVDSTPIVQAAVAATPVPGLSGLATFVLGGLLAWVGWRHRRAAAARCVG